MNKIFTVIICLMITASTFAQQHVCGVTHEDQMTMVKMIEEYNKRSQDPSYARSADPIFIPIKFHLVADNDGKGRIKANQMLQQMAVLIEDYRKLDMYLYLDDYGWNLIDNSSIYLNPGSFENSIVSRKDNNAVNIFITENANTSSGAGVVLGFYSPSGDYIIIRNNDVAEETSSLSHELGHLFGLPHTFFGWEGYTPEGGNGWTQNTFNGQVTASTVPGSGAPIELVDGSNCTTAADRICDTPPDYNFGFGFSGCEFNIEILDRNGDLVEPMERNYMGYFIGCKPYEFTQGQIDVMYDNYNSPARANIRKDYIPDTAAIVTDHELLFPAQSEKLDYYNQIVLDWSDATNATHYLVSVTASGENYEFTTDKSELFIEELTKDKFYFWEVKPFNDGYTDTDEVSSFFTTGSEENTASIAESQIIQNVNVYPNPAQLGSNLNISLSMTKTSNVSTALIDITGNIVMKQSSKMNDGINHIILDSNKLSSGIYILKLDTEDGAIHKKVIIQ